MNENYAEKINLSSNLKWTGAEGAQLSRVLDARMICVQTA
jgi:hypothetical protein